MEYYGVAPSSDFFAHYGVKGMKWGVRKAIIYGNSAALSRHYNKAAKKLEKLTAKTDKEFVAKSKRQAAKYAPASAVLGGLGSALGTFAINSHLPMKQRAAYAGIVGGGSALASGVASGIENLKYRRMLSNTGYAKNKAKRKEFEKAMRESFKGTEYENKIGETKNAINEKLNVAKQMMSNPNKRSQTQNNTLSGMSRLTKKQQRDVNQAFKNWADAFEKHYQTGLSKGMSHEQAERYSNNYIAKHGFKPVSSSYKKRKS